MVKSGGSLAEKEKEVTALIRAVHEDVNNEKAVYNDMNEITHKVREGLEKLKRGVKMDELEAECFLEGVHCISLHMKDLKRAYSKLPLFHNLRKEARGEIAMARGILRSVHRSIRNNEHQQVEAFEDVAEEYRQINWSSSTITVIV